MITLEELKEAAAAYKISSFAYECSEIPENSLSIRWETGGAKGGNCWGGKARTVIPEDEPIEDFDKKALEAYKYVTNSEFFDEKEENEFTTEMYFASTEKGYTEYEYYGNWYVYTCRYISMEEAYGIIHKHSRVARIDKILLDLDEHGL